MPLHPDIQVDLETEIIQLDSHLRQFPGDEKARGKLNRKLSKWIDTLDITIFVASNEQKPWTSGELGYPTKPMLLKETSGFQQVGDYQCYIERGSRIENNFAGFVVDRKECSDFYGTLFGRDSENRKNRERFYREIDRFKADPRFTHFYIFVECDLITWLNYLPPKNPGNDLMINQKMAVLASLQARGAHVMWCGNRRLAVRMYREMVRQWCLKNYSRIIRGCGTYAAEMSMSQPRVVDEVRL
jgi:hypothetical protein